MRRWLLLASLVGGMHAHGQTEKINAWHTDLTVAPDGRLTVTEAINVHVEGVEFKRGIVRKLPLRFTDHNGRTHHVKYDLQAVQVFGATSPYHTATEGDDFVVYVGSEGNFLQPGDYPYTLTYTTKGQLGFFPDFDEIYWNVNGNGWAFTVDSISALIHLPSPANVKKTACYTGVLGSTENACRDSAIDAHTVYFTGRALDMYEGLTVAVGFQKGVVVEPPRPTFWEEHAIPLVGGGITLLLLIYYLITWIRFGRDPDTPTVIPLFEAPDGLSPASVAMVMKGGEDNDQITPAMIHLAVKGYVRIEEKKEDVLLGLFSKRTYTIRKLKGGSGLPKEEQALLNSMFGSGRDRFEFDGSYDPSVQSMASSFRSSLRHQWHGFLNAGKNLRFWWIPILTVVVCGVALLVLYASSWGDNDGLYIAAFLVANLVLFLLYQYLIRKPSVEKLALRARLRGFRMYLSAAEERQLQHFNPPAMTPEVFEHCLPYAIAFGVEEVWGERFQSMIDKALVDPNYRTTWYSGSVMNYGSFSHSMSSSFSRSVQSSSTPPSKSGGSGGGGSSGGGGGGGGGGGW
ncbi:MAG: DUF2207 domain-containing protein [Flavobacteriales bacterium]|nr:DUF2207 domain-containing protein [Flavobacteriales bacterium]MBK7940923.1 DUF2207 domain-containing protein [Flavobacteriales bacterium]MBK8948428.1 DUF2207 domain-containing protein [Flavobacteriales bacterium]MBK9701654.1 DUF2207 domain-containing protein [Flavobacteriales bacterium]